MPALLVLTCVVAATHLTSRIASLSDKKIGFTAKTCIYEFHFLDAP